MAMDDNSGVCEVLRIVRTENVTEFKVSMRGKFPRNCLCVSDIKGRICTVSRNKRVVDE